MSITAKITSFAALEAILIQRATNIGHMRSLDGIYLAVLTDNYDVHTLLLSLKRKNAHEIGTSPLILLI